MTPRTAAVSVQVADFGISRTKDPLKTYIPSTANQGTPNYMAPEQFNDERHLDEKVSLTKKTCMSHPVFRLG